MRIIHHTDMDGITAGAIAYNMINAGKTVAYAKSYNTDPHYPKKVFCISDGTGNISIDDCAGALSANYWKFESINFDSKANMELISFCLDDMINNMIDDITERSSNQTKNSTVFIPSKIDNETPRSLFAITGVLTNIKATVTSEPVKTYRSGYYFDENDDRYSNINTGEVFMFVDLSLSNKAIPIINKIVNNGGRVLWLDHHKSSLDIVNNPVNADLVNNDKVKIFIDTTRSGALLTYDFFISSKEIFDFLVKANEIISNSTDPMIHVTNRMMYSPDECTKIMYPYLVDDYDRWEWKLKYTSIFKYGWDASISEKVDSYDQYMLIMWSMYELTSSLRYAVDLISEISKYDTTITIDINLGQVYLMFISVLTSLLGSTAFNNVVGLPNSSRLYQHVHEVANSLFTSGSNIEAYDKHMKTIMYAAFGARFHVKIQGGTESATADNYSFTDIFDGTVAVINRTSNSIIFGEDYNIYPLCVTFTFDPRRNEYKYSLYSNTKKFDTDCSAIAKLFGGGGHKGAAGFTYKVNLFELNVPKETADISMIESSRIIDDLPKSTINDKTFDIIKISTELLNV